MQAHLNPSTEPGNARAMTFISSSPIPHSFSLHLVAAGQEHESGRGAQRSAAVVRWVYWTGAGRGRAVPT